MAAAERCRGRRQPERRGSRRAPGAHLAQLAESEDRAALAAAIRRILDGERDEDALAAGLDDIDRATLHRILVGIADAAGGRAVDG